MQNLLESGANFGDRILFLSKEEAALFHQEIDVLNILQQFGLILKRKDHEPIIQCIFFEGVQNSEIQLRKTKSE